MLPENPVMVCVGIVLMLASRFSKWRNEPFSNKPVRPLTAAERVILFSYLFTGPAPQTPLMTFCVGAESNA